MDCEVCGRSIYGEPYRAVIEGAKLLVCSKCSDLSSLSWNLERREVSVSKTLRKPRSARIRETRSLASEDLELVEDWNTKIRKAREKLGLNHAELGKKIGEKVSVLQKLETGKMILDNNTIRKLERVLRIELLKPYESLSIRKEMIVRKPIDITIGDIIGTPKDKKNKKS